MPSIQRLILCHPLILPPSTFPSIRVFSNESALHIRWPKHWSFRLNISPSNEYSGLISTRMDWLDLHAGHGTLKSLLQHHSSKESILLYSAFFIVKLSHAYTTTGKTIALTRWAFVGKVMSLLFNMLPRFIITYENSERLYLGDSNITEVGDCSHEIKRCLLLGNKVMTNLDSILKSRDIALSIKALLVKTMVFLVVMYGCESWTIKKAEHRRIDVFELWCWRRLLRVPWPARRSNQSILKEISPGGSLEILMLKLKL